MIRVIAQILIAVTIASTGALAQNRRVEWVSYGSDIASSKYLPLGQIDAANFEDLEIAWTWDSPDQAIVDANPDNRNLRRIGFKATPLMVGGNLYFATALGQVAAVDAATGETQWIFNPESYSGGAPASAVGFLHRGVSYWTDGKVGRVLCGTLDGYLIAIDAKTGKLDSGFGSGGKG